MFMMQPTLNISLYFHVISHDQSVLRLSCLKFVVLELVYVRNYISFPNIYFSIVNCKLPLASQYILTQSDHLFPFERYYLPFELCYSPHPLKNPTFPKFIFLQPQEKIFLSSSISEKMWLILSSGKKSVQFVINSVFS